MNLLSNLDDVADIIIRPSRHHYKPNDLGNKSFTFEGLTITRNDFQVKNKRSLTLRGSIYTKPSGSRSENVLIYLHCNSGCRVQGLTYLRLALQNDFSYVVFDFSGSGMSQGRYISLGFHEVQDLQAVISHIHRNFSQDAKISLWGRSMGAVTALRYLSNSKKVIRAAIFDSPFRSLNKLFIEIGKERTSLPEILLNVAYKYIQPIILQKAQFDIDQVSLDSLLHQISTPGIFIASKHDSLIPFEHIEQVFSQYQGDKEMFFVEESHNEPRNMNVIRQVFRQLKKYLNACEQVELKKQKTSFYSFFPQKEGSRKKLQLTLKSHSQRQLRNPDYVVTRPQSIKLQFVTLAKRQTSCLFAPNKLRREKKLSDIVINNSSTSFHNTKREPLAPRNIQGQLNMVQKEEKPKPKFSGEAKIIEIKMLTRTGKSRERKTLQHISSKRPPFVELRGIKENRSSLDLRYRL